MKRHIRKQLVGALVAALPGFAGAGVVSAELGQQLLTAPAGQPLPVIIQLADRVSVKQFPAATRGHRDNRLLLALKDKAARTQGPLAAAVSGQGGTGVRQLWIINGIAARLPPAAIRLLALFPGVGRITTDSSVSVPVTATASSGTATWNLTAVGAPALWARGLAGGGLVVANMDTGVDPDHPDIVGKWRGGGNSWYDPHGQHATPYDASGHGTQTMGLMVGGNASGSTIGVAPDANWIAAKLFDDAGNATLSDIHLAFQWLLDPDNNPATIDSPDVVNASWGLIGGAPGACNIEFDDDIRALKTAGIAVVFAAGNDGPAAATSQSPANNVDSFSAGSIDSQSVVASNSSRGPSGCDATIYPKLVAPGVNVLTADRSFGGLPVYATVSGTSFAAPHVAGIMALLAGAFPAASVDQIESALTASAQDLGAAGADNNYGYGLVNGDAAYQLLAAAAGTPPTITSTPGTSALQDMPYSYQVVASDSDGGALAFSLDTAPAGMAIDVNGLISWTPGAGQVGSNAVTVRVVDAGGLAATQSFSITVIAANRPPVSADDSYAAVKNKALSVAAPGVLANDSDPDGNPLGAIRISGPAHGSLTLNADGSFVYTPATDYVGTDSFGYAASDGSTTGNTATVVITIAAPNKAPVAANDSYSAPKWTTGTYKPRVFSVLANDKDSDGSLDPASIAIVSQPSAGGKVTANLNGTVSYTPKLKFTGRETFRYTVRDNKGATSNAATVTVTVQ